MRIFFATVLFTFLAFFATQSVCRSEYFQQLMQHRREAKEKWAYSYTKRVDLLDVNHSLFGGWDRKTADAMEAKLHAEQINSRCFVTRKRGEKMPTWDGYTAAIILDPTIWYFDPDSRRYEGCSPEALIGPKYERPRVDFGDGGPTTHRCFVNFRLEHNDDGHGLNTSINSSGPPFWQVR